jgi:Zn-dependent protease
VSPTFTIGRIAGIRIGLNWSWLVVFALITWSLAASVFPSEDPGLSNGSYLVMGLAAALLFFGSLLLHEAGHALEARREGMEIEGITLWLFGGVARFRGAFPSAGAEFRIAIAGPLVSLVLGLAFVGIALESSFSKPLDSITSWLGYANLFLLVFNLVPALPLDGGRVLRAGLWRIRGDFVWATRIAAEVGQAIGGGMIALGSLLVFLTTAWNGLWLAFLGWFLLSAARAEGRFARVREALGARRVADVMIRAPLTVEPDDTVEELMTKVGMNGGQRVFPVTVGSQVLGLIPLTWAVSVPRDEWVWRHIAEGLVPLKVALVLRPDSELFEATEELAAHPLHAGIVLAGNRLVGFLSLEDVERVLPLLG